MMGPERSPTEKKLCWLMVPAMQTFLANHLCLPIEAFRKKFSYRASILHARELPQRS